MSDYPRLSEMGIAHPEEISYYSVSSIDYNDFLRIIYDRPDGSLLPTSRTYRFPRVQKSLGSVGDSGDDEVVMETSPTYREAVDELKAVMAARKGKQDIAAAMLDELRQLEEDFAMHSECLKSLVDKIRDT